MNQQERQYFINLVNLNGQNQSQLTMDTQTKSHYQSIYDEEFSLLKEHTIKNLLVQELSSLRNMFKTSHTNMKEFKGYKHAQFFDNGQIEACYASCSLFQQKQFILYCQEKYPLNIRYFYAQQIIEIARKIKKNHNQLTQDRLNEILNQLEPRVNQIGQEIQKKIQNKNIHVYKQQQQQYQLKEKQQQQQQQQQQEYLESHDQQQHLGLQQQQQCTEKQQISPINAPIDLEEFAIYEKLPLFLFDLKTFIINLLLFQRNSNLSYDSSDDTNIYVSLLGVSCGEQYQKIFNQSKELLKKLINNEKNGILNQYVKYASEYKQYYQKVQNNNKNFEPNLQKNNIKKILLQGIQQSSIILQPNRTVYGSTIQNKIVFNLNSFLRNIKHQFKCQEDYINSLISVICVTILHELCHYLIRMLNFKLKDNQSFFYANKQRKQYQNNNKFSLQNGKMYFLGKQIQLELAKFIHEKKADFLDLINQLRSKSQIDKKYDQIRQKTLQYLSQKYVSKIFQPENIVKLFDQTQTKESEKLQMQNLQNNSMIWLFDAVYKKSQTYINIQKNKQMYEFISRMTQGKYYRTLAIWLQNNIPDPLYKFIEKSCTQISIKNFKYCSQEELLQFIKLQQINEQLESQQKLVNHLLKTLNINNQKQRFYVRKMLNVLFIKPQCDVSDVFMYFEDWKESYHKVQLIEKMQWFFISFGELLSQCKQFVNYNNLSVLQRQQKLESDWIIEKRLFPNKAPGKSYLYAGDYEILNRLANQQNQNKCFDLRKLFANQNFAKNEKKNGSRVFISREAFRQSPRVKMGYCLHYLQRFGRF